MLLLFCTVKIAIPPCPVSETVQLLQNDPQKQMEGFSFEFGVTFTFNFFPYIQKVLAFSCLLYF